MLPFPIAFPRHLIDAARSPAERYDRLILCFEAVVRYLATAQLSDYLAAGCPDAAFNNRLLTLLGQKRACGHWSEVIREVARLQHSGRIEAFISEIPRFYFTHRGKPTPEAELLDSVLLNARNEWAHRDRTWSESDYEARWATHFPQLQQLLTAIAFLDRYPLYVPTVCDPQGRITAALHLDGPTSPPRHVHGLSIALSPQVKEHIRLDLTALVCHPDDPGRHLLLAPLALFATNGGEKDIYLFNRCTIRGRKVSALDYHAIQVNQEPLTVRPGPEFDSVVSQFHDLLGRLTDCPSDTPQHRPLRTTRRAGRRWPLVTGCLALLAVTTGLVFAVRAFSPAGGQTPAEPPATPTRAAEAIPLRGSVDLLVYRVDHTGSDKLVSLDHPLALPLRTGDHFKVVAELNRPAYLYLFWTDENGNTVPMHPWSPSNWGTRPHDEKPTAQLDLVAPNGKGFKLSGDANGMETILMIAQDEKLTPTDDEVKGWFAGLKPLPFRGEQARVWFENFDVVRSDAKRAFTIDGDVDAVDGPVGLQRAVKGRVSGVDFSRAISFARVGPNNK